MSWSWVSKAVEKKILDQIGKQINIESKTICKYCEAMIPKEAVFCPKCRRSLK